MQNTQDTVGFIGLGQMGGPMVSHLLEAGYSVHAWARNPARYDSLPVSGLVRMPSQEELFKHCSLVFLNVTTTDDVEALLFGPSGVASHAQPGTLVVDFSTIDSKAAAAFAEKLSSLGIEFIDCPVSGGSAGARAASLTMMAGGSKQAFEKAIPYLMHLGKTVRHVGPAGAGQAIKAANQMSMCIQLAGIAEAFNYAREQGADLQACYELLSAGLAGSKVLDWAGPHMVEGFARPATIESRLHAKDLKMIADAAQRDGLNLPLTQKTAELLDELVQAGLGHADTAQVYEIVRKNLR